TAVSPEGTAISAHIANQSLERKAFGNSQAVDMATDGMDVGMGNGWDTGDNSFDFVVQSSPNPQNSASDPEQPEMMDGGGPMIMHMPINSAVTGADLNITAQMGDPMTPIENIVAELHYIASDLTPANNTISTYTTLLGVHQSNGFFKFTIPSASVTIGGLHYYLKVVTDGGTAFMSTNPMVDMGAYDAVVLQEEAVAVNPFAISVASTGTTYTISGQVTNEASAGINGVLVMIEGTGYSATTANNGADGQYSISVPNGIYNITMIKDGFFEEWINDIFVNGGAVTVNRTMFAGTGGGMTGDSEKPMVMWTGPPDGMMGVPSGMDDFKIFIGFSKDIDTTTFTTSSVVLTDNPSGSAEVSLSGYTA
ncbi:MAG: carboxypeptidase regulatory-like domain-containing protein, partial [Candidatus Pacebacteria bacterium]|nr:carboxypeptidase regulatory-like domain-containing protein [Candidatus Paceibacterota bacterium]